MQKVIKFIDLFAGLGGTRLGFEYALQELGYTSKCVFTSEIKDYAIKAYKENFNNDNISGDITKIQSKDIPSFDFLLAGFPCQPFSSAGSRKGFGDTRGTLFFEIERIIKDKQPMGFLLENVEGLLNHDGGRTLQVIIDTLQGLGYQTSYKVINASDIGVPQNRKRIYIVGNKKNKVSLDSIKKSKSKLKDILESGHNTTNTKFTKQLLSYYKTTELHGKSIKDKRGGPKNIHSWDIELKGAVSKEQKEFLNQLLKERRKKEWAIKKGIKWMDGMPLTLDEISTFYNVSNGKKQTLKDMLDDLVNKKYLRYEHPKEQFSYTDNNGNLYTNRQKDETKEKGYNIVSGKLSFEITKILDPDSVAPTLVATDASRIAIVDKKGIRKLTIREGLRLFGYPESYHLNTISYENSFDLLGNTVVVPVIKEVAKALIKTSLS